MWPTEHSFAPEARTGLTFVAWILLLLPGLLLPVLVGPLPRSLSGNGWLIPAVLGLCRWQPLRLPAALLLLSIHASEVVHEQLEARYLGPQRILVALFEIESVTGREAVPSSSLTTAPGSQGGLLLIRLEVRVLLPATTLDRGWQGRRLRLLARASPSTLREKFRAGQRVWLRVRIRPPFGRHNFVGFDRERWLFQNRIAATGTVLGGWATTVNSGGALERVRDRVRRSLAELRQGAWISALLLGDRSGLQPADWRLLRSTGTVHLLVVSGLHVSITALFGLLLGFGLGRGLMLIIPRLDARWPALLIAALVSGLYVGISGYGVPAQRAWIMTNLGLGCWALGRSAVALPALLLALLVILVIDPLAALGTGLWLSFCAVGLLLLWFRTRRRQPRALAGFVEAQLVVCLGLQPLLSAGGAPLALAAPFANLIAVPLVSWIILPLGLLALLLSLLMQPGVVELLNWVNTLLEQLLILLDFLSGLPEFQAPRARALPLFMALVLLLLLWRPLRLRHWVAVTLLLVTMIQPVPELPAGEFRLTVLDAGQGDAVLLETRHHTLLFDTGGAFLQRSLLLESAVLPLLRRSHRSGLDGLVVSHDDLDHAGGEQELLRALTVRAHWRSGPGAAYPKAVACRRGRRWVWDQVRFEFLHPARSTPRDGRNEQSCVLLIRNAAGSAQVLLPGDIDAAAEAGLQIPMAPVTVTLMPHHGSRTSSSPAFVRRLHARIAVASAPRFSRFGHPHPDVLRRYQGVGSEILQTGVEGALRWHSDEPLRVIRARCVSAYWARGNGEHCPGQPLEGDRGGA